MEKGKACFFYVNSRGAYISQVQCLYVQHEKVIYVSFLVCLGGSRGIISSFPYTQCCVYSPRPPSLIFTETWERKRKGWIKLIAKQAEETRGKITVYLQTFFCSHVLWFKPDIPTNSLFLFFQIHTDYKKLHLPFLKSSEA